MSDRAQQSTLERPPPAVARRAAAARTAPLAHPLEAEHAVAGNRAIQRRALDPPIAAPEDEHEREAERVTALVASGGSVGPGAIGDSALGIGRQATEREQRKREDDRKLARKPARAAPAPAVTGAVSASIGGARGSGRALSPGARSFFEPRLGHDLGAVRVHDDAAAARAAQDLEAEAFTYGQDVFFGAGRFQPDTAHGRRLLAHELTHTIQQRPGAPLHRRAIQRNGTRATTTTAPGAAAPTAQATVDPRSFATTIGKLEGEGPDQTVRFDRIQIPRFKLQDHRGELYTSHRPLHHIKRYDRGDPRQRDKWRDSVPGTQAVIDELRRKAGPPPVEGAPYVFAAPPPKRDLPPRFFIGDLATIASTMNLPSWDAAGRPHEYDVDHIVELQLSGYDKSPSHWSNQLPNMELLDASANRSSGSRIADHIDTRVRTFLEATTSIERYPRSADTLKNRFHLKFDEAVPEAQDAPRVGRNEHWRQQDIERGDHVRLAQVRVAHPSERGDEGHVKVFSRATGGVPKTFRWAPGRTTPDREHEAGWLEPFTITRKTFNVAPGELTAPTLGTLIVALPEGNDHWRVIPPTPIDVPRLAGLPFMGHLDRAAMRAKLAELGYRRASPVRIEEEPDVLPQGGIGVRGQILPDVPALQGVAIDFQLAGDDIRIWKAFSLGEIQVPRPFVVNDVTLVAEASTRTGLRFTGQVDFAIERVGQGVLRGVANTQRGIEFEGQFDFDQRLFDPPAQLRVAYREGAWSGSGVLGIAPGKVPGIRRGRFEASYAEGRLEASGAAETTVPGVSEAALALMYSEAEGLTLAGQLTLAPNLPGLRGGTLQARVQQRPETGDYRVTARGEAQPAIPGVDATLLIDYDDGALTVQGSAAYANGPVAGQLTLGATNRPVDPEGNIVATGVPTEQITAYGGGRATVQLTPWLQGTVGLRILPNGQVELSGAIGLPAVVEVFPERSYTRNLLTIGIDIPIVGVSVLGQRIGIFATIEGGVDLSAGVGPGQLRELGVAVTFNPDQPDRTHIEGGARLTVPAHAGLRLFVRGGLGVGIPVVSASARLEIGGGLTIEGLAEAEVHVDWTPARGLVLDAAASVSLEPRLRFDVVGSVLVEADLLLDTITLYEERWNLGSVEYGSGLRLGMRLPIHYEEGKPFDVNWNDVQFDIPDINPREVLSGLVAQIA